MDSIKTYYRVWWQAGGYKHFDSLDEAQSAVHPKRGVPARIDKIEIIFLDDTLPETI